MDLLDRIHQRLVAALASRPGDSDTSPARLVTVADIYQHLVPYRQLRGEGGVMELAEYEHALLRLLAGERGYVRVIDPGVTLELQLELASTNPILGIYRDYAGVGVSVGQTAMQSDRSTRGVPDDGSRTQSPAVTAAPAAAPAAAPSRVREPGPPTGRVGHEPAEVPLDRPENVAPALATANEKLRSAAKGRSAEPIRCSTCRRDIPDQPGIHFCPFCGTAKGPMPCVRCGSTLEVGWHFCGRCGSPRQVAPPAP